MERFKEFKSKLPFSGLLIFIAGLLLLLFPGYSGKGLCYIVSGVLIVRGASRLIAYWRRRPGADAFPMNSLWNALLIGLGLFIAINSSIVISIVPFAFGIYFLTSSISSLNQSMALKRMQYQGWGQSLLFSLLRVVLAVIMLTNPFATAMALIRFMGGCLIYDSVTGLAASARVVKADRQAEKARRELRDLNLNRTKTSRTYSSPSDGDIPVVEAEVVEIVEEHREI